MHTKYVSHQWRIIFFFIIFTVITGCIPRNYLIQRSLYDNNLPVRKEIHEVPFYPQETNQCGPAALATTLEWSGSHVTSDEIANEIYTPGRKGTLQPLLISATRFHDRLPYVIRDLKQIINEVAAGHPVIVFQNLGLSWYPKWHYAVLIGYDMEKRIMILRSGRFFRKKSSLSLFVRTWERAGKWAMAVLPLSEMPASADKEAYLEAAAAMEDVNKPMAASVMYETALKKWPGSPEALIGLGNSRYSQGDLEGAREAFSRAANYCENCGDVFNNLAHVLAEQKFYKEAIQAANEAVRIGGPNVDIYRETLKSVMLLLEDENSKKHSSGL